MRYILNIFLSVFVILNIQLYSSPFTYAETEIITEGEAPAKTNPDTDANDKNNQDTAKKKGDKKNEEEEEEEMDCE